MTIYPCRMGCGSEVKHPNGRCLPCYRATQNKQGRNPYDCAGKCGAKVRKPGGRCRRCYLKRKGEKPLYKGRPGFYCLKGCGAIVARSEACSRCMKTNQCISCKKPIYPSSTRCRACQRDATRREPSVLAKVNTSPSHVTSSQRYPCLNGCGAMMTRQDARCLKCRKARQNVIAATSEQTQRRKRALKSLQDGDGLAIMEFGTEIYIMSNRCQNPACKKPIVLRGFCFSCATSRRYTIPIRPRITLKPEREKVSA